MTDFNFLCSKITADSDCSHKIKRLLLLGRKAITDLDSVLQSIISSILSLLYGPTLTSIQDYWKNHSFDYIQTFVNKVMSLLINTLSRFVIAFLPRSKHLLISWLQSLSAVILEPNKIKSVTSSSSVCHEVMLAI